MWKLTWKQYILTCLEGVFPEGWLHKILENTSAMDPEPSQTSATPAMDQEPMSIADSEPKPATKTVIEPIMEVVFFLDPEPHGESDQVHELAPKSVPEGIVDFRI